MGNQMVPSNGNPVVGQQCDGWTWDGSRWVCDPDAQPPCPPAPTMPWPPFVFPSPPMQPPWYPGANGAVSFSTTPPPNPVRGHFWWDGLTLRIFDGAAFVTVGGAGSGGAVVSVSQPTAPLVGQLWWNGSALQVWDGTKWVNITTGTPGGGGGSGAGTVVISSTAPGSPVAGMQWWNGSVLQVFDGVTWNVVGPGQAAGPVPTTTVVFSLTQTGYFNAPANWDIVSFTATPQVDTLLGWDPNTKKFTPKKAGIYLFEATIWEGAGGGIALAKNDGGTWTNDVNHPAIGISTLSAGGYLEITGTSVMNGTTDFVRMFGWSSAGQFWGNPTPPVLAALLLP